MKKHKLKANSIPMISQYIEATIEDFIKSQEAERPDEISPSNFKYLLLLIKLL